MIKEVRERGDQREESNETKCVELGIYGHHGYSDIDHGKGERTQPNTHQGAETLTQREALPLALLLQWSPTFDPLLLVLELHSLAIELVLHLLVSSI